MDKRERMARDKRAKAKAGRVERVQRRRKALDTARAVELERRKAVFEERRRMLEDVAAGRYPGSHGEPADTDTGVKADDMPTPSENDTAVTAQGEAAS
jgi:hypothetical protein